MEKIDPVLYRQDIVKFYELYSRISEGSPNIGVVGDFKSFNMKMQEVIKKYKYSHMYKRKDGHIITIFVGDNETTFVHIESLQDLYGWQFRKYM